MLSRPPAASVCATGRRRSYRVGAARIANLRVANMKLTIERVALLKALGHVQSVVERRNTIPILSNVLLRADSGGPQAAGWR